MADITEQTVGRAELFNLGLLLWVADEGVDVVAGINKLRGGELSDLAVSTDVQNLLLKGFLVN